MQSADETADPGFGPQNSPERQGEPGRLQVFVRRLLAALDGLVGGLATIALVSLIAIVFANVIGRYVFNSSLPWAVEAAQWLFIGIIFLAIPLAHRARMHMSIRLLVDKLPPFANSVANFLADMIIAYATIMLLFGGTFLMQALGGTNHVLNLPVWIKFSVVPVSCVLGLIFLALRGIDEGKEPWRQPLTIVAAFGLYWAMNDGGLISLEGLNPALVMGISFISAMALGAPVSFSMVFSAFLANAAGGTLPPPAVVLNMVNGSSKFLLLAVPFFITAGALMNVGSLTKRLTDFAHSLVGHLRGGLAQGNVVSSLMYAGISGSSYSDAAMGTKLLVPQMVRYGYSPQFSCAVTAASATLPNVIPPSIALLILAAVANLSVGSLWLAGVGPGIVMAICLMGCIYLVSRLRGYGAGGERASYGIRARAFVQAFPVLILAFLILGGIRFGAITPTEAGVLAVVYAWVLGMLVYRAYNLRGVWAALRSAAIEAALIGLLIGAASPFAFILVTEQVPQVITSATAAISSDPNILIVLAILLLLLFGMFLDIGASILILTPLLMPVVTAAGVDPIHFGIVIVVTLMLGGLTPPVGMLVFITGTVSRTPVHEIFRAMLPLLGALIAALLLIAFLPAISLGLGWLVE